MAATRGPPLAPLQQLKPISPSTRAAWSAARSGVWPELQPVRIAHCWTGFVGMTADHIPHMGTRDGIHYAVGCNNPSGSGVGRVTVRVPQPPPFASHPHPIARINPTRSHPVGSRSWTGS